MDYVDDKYIRLLSTRLEKYKHVKSGLYNFRCPYCGDSQKHKNKARGYFFLKKTEFIYKCHNCGVGRSLSNFLKENAVDLHDQYIMEKYKQGMTGKGRHTPNPEYKSAKPYFAEKVDDLVAISDLNKGHPARDYLEGRQIPQEKLSSLYYTDKFKRWVNTKVPNTFENLQNDRPRIIIPFIDKDGNWFGIQGRSLAANATLRYITILFNQDSPKIYGLDSIDTNQTVYVTEGPLDSLFIRNSVAMCGADLDINNWGISDSVWIYDNEPRNKQIVERIAKTIQRGHKVVIWDSQIKEKDINDMVLAGRNVNRVIECNTFQGLEAQVKFTNWKKV
jgi:hypothetical protein